MPVALDRHGVTDRLRETCKRPIKSYRRTGVPACQSRSDTYSARDGRFAEGGPAMTFIVVSRRRTEHIKR